METEPGWKRWEGVVEDQATLQEFDLHHLQGARVQSSGICTQSVMSTVAIPSNLTGPCRTKNECRKWFLTRRKNISGQNLGAINLWMHGAFLHANCVSTVHTHVLGLSNSRRQRQAPRRFWGFKSGADRNYSCCWQRMDTHAWRVHISVQLLASLLHFIMSDPPQRHSNMDDHPGPSNKGCSLHAPHFSTLDACMSLAYAYASVLLSNIRRWTHLWSRAVLQRWSTMEGARRQHDGTCEMVPDLHSMGRVRNHLN